MNLPTLQQKMNQGLLKLCKKLALSNFTICLQHRPSEDVRSDSLDTTHIKRKQTISKLMGDEKQGLDQIIKIKLNCVGSPLYKIYSG